jgi:hypothetical protein
MCSFTSTGQTFNLLLVDRHGGHSISSIFLPTSTYRLSLSLPTLLPPSSRFHKSFIGIMFHLILLIFITYLGSTLAATADQWRGRSIYQYRQYSMLSSHRLAELCAQAHHRSLRTSRWCRCQRLQRFCTDLVRWHLAYHPGQSRLYPKCWFHCQ